jgi:hypothetical protein
VDWHKHHIFFAAVAIVVAVAFLALFTPYLGFIFGGR